MACYRMGPETHAIPMTLFRENREKVIAELRKGRTFSGRALILLQGGDNISLYDTDVDYVFRQESYFTYLFGVTEPGCYGTVDVASGATTLYMPRLPAEYAVWMGPLLTPDDFRKKYEVDAVHYADEIESKIAALNPSVLLTLAGPNTDSGLQAKPANFSGIEKFVVDSDILFPVIAECRVIKSPAEIEVLRYVARVSSDAHKQVMKQIRPGWHEYQGESVFLHHSYSVGGCRHMSYTCICGAGSNSAILHYGHAGSPNDRLIQDGDMCLFDMGANYGGYTSDITCSFPVNGKFTDDQKLVYNAVLAARDAVCASAKDGVSWVDMHLLANRVMLGELKKGGLLKGEVEDMMAAGLNAIFQPHGLGHLLGLDVHDVGGYLSHCPERPNEPGVNRLRMARKLKAGMYVTIEPGCYFIEPLLNKAFADPNMSQFLKKQEIDRFRNFGGVRIEDDVLITENGIENFTFVPRTVEEIEAWMAQS
ncbi:xaa-Pro dipeptidase isoform X1 [Wyeomyia smithii]|uniref:xaa-Pro dipeptidase isoform X1 n=2 Tax=Wyeomyia smithii TaxID=174621 RepID=UPI002467DB0E|nr:xaa-Pro dipeptidase isoform X1 [Wyeomyia smithii]XP_055538051.1 xaa-Pro dipeptidase isoform X1 [Wyeomyia smithii]XP_055538052.1 xaa-Pro dipeptidase isoform X1 [Wyeomyia smithii]XP_055538053.1 xaa-Pro dipeptidase isoform X1 [Wyeomyia smithii]XP_055538054.1 xaa-Pro dipeptidase isoform X1 [Wyeomyia smithii]XP_055538056.1 xaa-Pro dipeptidase isoform X1 [Wyeomyia smithii]